MTLTDIINISGVDNLDCKVFAGFGKEGVKYPVTGIWIEDTGNIVLAMDKDREEKIFR